MWLRLRRRRASSSSNSSSRLQRWAARKAKREGGAGEHGESHTWGHQPCCNWGYQNNLKKRPQQHRFADSSSSKCLQQQNGSLSTWPKVILHKQHHPTREQSTCPSTVVAPPPTAEGRREVPLAGCKYLSLPWGAIRPSNITIWRTNMDTVSWKRRFTSLPIATIAANSCGASWDKVTYAKVSQFNNVLLNSNRYS